MKNDDDIKKNKDPLKQLSKQELLKRQAAERNSKNGTQNEYCSQNETKFRLDISEGLKPDLINLGAKSIFLIGSVAYAPNENVSPDSDLDLLVVCEDLSEAANHYLNKEEADLIRDRCQGFSVKFNAKDDMDNSTDVSIHFLSKEGFEKIIYGSDQPLVQYRSKPKTPKYIAIGFDGKEYEYDVGIQLIKGMNGVLRFDLMNIKGEKNCPAISNDEDKLLSGGYLIHDEGNYGNESLEKLWARCTSSLNKYYEQNEIKTDQTTSMEQFLFRQDRFSPETSNYILERTQDGLKQAGSHIKKDNSIEKGNKPNLPTRE